MNDNIFTKILLRDSSVNIYRLSEKAIFNADSDGKTLAADKKKTFVEKRKIREKYKDQ